MLNLSFGLIIISIIMLTQSERFNEEENQKVKILLSYMIPAQSFMALAYGIGSAAVTK